MSLPLALLGQGTRVTLLAAEQGFVIQRATSVFQGVRLPIGVGPAELGDHTGWGAGARAGLESGDWRLSLAFDASTRQYTRTRARLAWRPVFVAYGHDRRPAEEFFGIGRSSSLEGEAHYGLTQQRLDFGLQFNRSGKGLRGADVRRDHFEVWAGPRWSLTDQGLHPNQQYPSLAVGFPQLAAGTMDQVIEHFRWGARLDADRRTGRPHWTHGWRASFSAERFDRPLASSPERTGTQFTRYDLLAETSASFGRDPRTLRLSFTATDNEVGPGEERFLPSDFARLGGRYGITGYEPRRFHDLDAMNLRLSWIFPLAAHVEWDVHGDAGGVFKDLQHDAKPNRLTQSAGFALRARTALRLVGTAGLDFSRETVRFVFSLGGES